MPKTWFEHLEEPAAAWGIMTAAIALHVLDEAVSGFLDFYNPLVTGIRESFPLFPMPTFTFAAWSASVAIGIGVLALLTPLAGQRARWLRVGAFFLSVLMILDAVGRLAGSLYLAALVPGTFSSPLLLLAALNLFTSAREKWELTEEPPLETDPNAADSGSRSVDRARERSDAGASDAAETEDGGIW